MKRGFVLNRIIPLLASLCMQYTYAQVQTDSIKENTNKNVIFIYDTTNAVETIINIDTVKTTVIKQVVIDTIITNTTKRWTAGFTFSPLVCNNKIVPHDEEFSPYTDLLISSEEPAVSFSLRGGISYNHKNWIFQSGISYSRFSTNTNYNVTNIAIDSSQWVQVSDAYMSIDTVDEYIIYNNGVYNTHYITKPVWEEADSAFASTVTPLSCNDPNTYSYIEIPLLIGYKLTRDKFSYSIKGGLLTGFLIGMKGKTIPLNQLDTIAALENSSFHKVIMSYNISIGVSYLINNNISIYAEPYYRGSLNSLLNTEFYIRKINASGIHIGIQYKY